ncbi:MAG TPA: potassium channel family protein [Acidimicrobiales bacterium]
MAGSPDADRLRIDNDYRYAILLIVATILTFAASGQGWLGRLASVCIAGFTLLVLLHMSDAARRTRRIAGVAVAGALALTIVSEVGHTDSGHAFQLAVGVLLAFAGPVVIVNKLARRRRIDLTTISGSLCVYLLAGLAFAFMFALIDVVEAGPFFVQTDTVESVDFVYFSFTTLATLGYGDLTAVGDYGRLLSVTEALLGQLYLVSVVALVVSNVEWKRRGPDGRATP